jgi:hypothetical protein
VVSIARPIAAPPRSRWSPLRAIRGLVPAEGWSSVFLLAIVLLSTAWTVARTDVAPDGVSMAILATGGLLVGLVLAKLRAADLLAHLFAALSGLVASVLLAVERMPLAPGGRLERLRALNELAVSWIATAQAGDRLDDPRLLAIMLGMAVWLVAYTSAWVLFRRGWLTTALALPGVIALANLGYAPEQGTLPLLVLVVAATMLAARHAAYRRQVEWARAHLPYPRRTAPRFLLGGILVALLVAALAWTLPLSARDALTGAAWERLSEPLEQVSDRWNDLLRRVGGTGTTSGGSYSAFGESFQLGGHLDLSDEPVMVLAPSEGPMRPVYLAGQRYDAYDGRGWQTTVEETFQEVGPDGQRYSSRVSFRSGQAVVPSPDLVNARSQVEGVIEVVRPKGDLLFTIDAHLAADRRTNVQVSWQRLDNAPFPIATREDLAALPLELRGIGVLLRSGTYTPPADGGVNADSPLPLDPSLAAEVQAARDALQSRFLDVRWEIGPDGTAQTLRATGQIPMYDDVEAVFSQERVSPGDVYAVEGLTSTADPDALRAAGTDYPAWVTDRYLQLPPTITDRTRQLAAQLAAGQPSAFDVAQAMESYVRETIAYNEAIEPPPADQDVVDYVLFDSREGYCEYYASAMAVLLRAEGIPSRVVGGYFPAPFDPAEGGHLYREKNAHLWVEAFFPGYGWIPFEPTANRDELSYGEIAAAEQEPAAPTPAPTPPPPIEEPTPVPAVETPVPEAPAPAQLLSDPLRLASWAAIMLAALLAVAATVMAGVWFAGFRGLTPVSSLYARALRAGRWLNVTPAPSMTPREYADQVGRMVPSAQGPARVVADLYTQERYAGRRPDGEAVQAARSAWRDLRGIALGGLLRRNNGGRGR